MSNVFYEIFEANRVKHLYEGINLMQSGDVLNLRNVDFSSRGIMLFADSLLARNFEGKFLVSRHESEDGVSGITVGRTAA